MKKHVLAIAIVAISTPACVGGQPPASPEPTQMPIVRATSVPTQKPAATTTPSAPSVRTPTAPPKIFVDSGRRLESDRTFSIALGDLDRDGDLDAVVANFLSSGKVWWNDGTGIFEEGQNVGEKTAHGVALGDLNGDGDLDAFIVHNGNVDQVWLNDGTGHLVDSGQQLGKPEDATIAVSLGDVDGDGDLDAFTVHYQQPVKLWLNDGGGVFAARDAGPGSDALGVAVGDVDGDGDLDALVSFVENPDRVWINDGRGAFADSGQALSGESGWGGAALGDVDGDGDLDAFVSNPVSGDAIWLNTGGAQGGTPGIFASSGQALGKGNYATLGDMDGDGDLDALTCQGLWLNDGGGTWRDAGIKFNVVGCSGVWLGDVDGDGDLDAFVGSHQRNNELWLNETQHSASGSGRVITFVDSGQKLGEERSTDVALGDLDGDGDLDALVGNEERAQVWVNDGRGGFSLGQDLAIPSGWKMGLDLGDLDGDGDLDAFVVVAEGPGRVLLNQGGAQGGTAGSFVDSGQQLGAPSGFGFDLDLGDVDGDGDLDAYVAQERANLVWLNDGQGVFQDSGQRLGKAITAGVALADLDGDGDLDALAGGWDEPGRVWLNDGQGAFADSGHALTAAEVHIHGLDVGDVDGDGDLDAFLSVASGHSNQVWLNDGQGVFSDSGQRLPSTLGHAVVLGDLDGDGDLDAFMANAAPSAGAPNTVWLNDGQGVFQDSGLRLGKGISYGVDLGDLDGDGDLDAFVVDNGPSGSQTGSPNVVWLNE